MNFDKIDTWGWVLLAILALNLFMLFTGGGILNLAFAGLSAYLAWMHIKQGL